MTLSLTTLSCKIAAMSSLSVNPMLKQLSAILVTSNTLVGIMIMGSKSQATAVNTLLVAAIANSINMVTSRPSTYILNGKDRFPNLHRSKIACGSGNLRSYQRSSTFLVFRSLVSCNLGIVESITDVIHFQCWTLMASESTKVNKLRLTLQDTGQTLFADALPLMGRRISSYRYATQCGHNKLVVNHSK